jgi:hypothetical protein
MSTAIIGHRLEGGASTTSEGPLLKTYWKWLLALFPGHQRSEKFDRLISHYRMLPVQAKASDANRVATELIEAIRLQTEHRLPSWSDIDAVERGLLTMMSGEDLRRFGWTLRAEFQRATNAVPADQCLLKAYHDSKPPEAEGPDEKRLMADLLTLQGQLHELYATRRVQFRARNLIAAWTVALFVVAIVVTLQLDKILKIPDTIVFDVFGVGMMGGLFSTLLRVQKFKLGGIREATALGEAGNQITVILAPAIGGAGAVVLFVLLAAGLLKGTFFPELPVLTFGKGADGLEDLFQLQLASSTEAAKLYLLCFLAGFSERLVPDVMSRLSAMAEKEG